MKSVPRSPGTGDFATFPETAGCSLGSGWGQKHGIVESPPRPRVWVELLAVAKTESRVSLSATVAQPTRC